MSLPNNDNNFHNSFQKKDTNFLNRTWQNSNFLLENLTGAFIALDKDWNICYFNKQAARLLRGKEIQTLLGKNLIEEFPEIKLSSFYHEVKSALLTNNTVRFEYYDTFANNWFDIHGYPTSDGISIYFNDITQQKRVEATLLDMENKYEILMQEASDAIIVTDINFHTIEVNLKAQEMLGYTKDELLQIDPKTLIHPDDIKLVPLRKDILTEGMPIKGIRHLRHKTGRYVSIDGTARKLSDGRMIFILRDFSEREMLERKKNDFISVASHELKTPVALINHYLKMITDPEQMQTEDQSLEYVAKLKMEVDHLTSLTNNLLDVSKIQEGKFQLHKSKFNVNECIQSFIEEIHPLFPTHGIILKGKANDDIYADKNLLRQVFINLITNAITYSPQADCVVVSLKCQNNNVVFGIQDFGIGISKKDLEKTFERFFSSEYVMTQQFSGIGLGLYIAKEIIRLHGGDIWAESVKGKGTTFSFRIPMQQQEF